MEVQNPNSGQTTVSWTATTRFSKIVKQSVGQLATGDCITVTGTASKSSKNTIAARSISVVPATASGMCTGRTGGSGGAFGGPGGPGGQGGPGGSFRTGQANGGTPPSFRGGTPPSFGGSSRRFGARRRRVRDREGDRREGFDYLGVGCQHQPGVLRTDQGLHLEELEDSKNAKAAAPKTQKLTITTSGSTALSATQSAASSDLAVGDCVSAFGPAAANGSVTATTVRITSTGGSTCTRLRRRAGSGSSAVVRERAPAVAVPRSIPGWGRAGHRRAVIAGALVLVVLLGGGAAAWATTGAGSSGGYRVATVARADIGQSLTVVGAVQPVNDSSAAFQVAGKVATVTATPGEIVSAGQTLGTLDTTALSESVSSAQSTVNAAEAKLVQDESSQSTAASSTPEPRRPRRRQRRPAGGPPPLHRAP